MKAKHYFLFVSLTALLSCQGGFYDYSRRFDLWRLPLIEPYELTQIAGVSKDEQYNWHLKFRTLYDSVSVSHVNVTMINVSNGIIYGFGTLPPCKHFIIDTHSGVEKRFNDVDEWNLALKHLGVGPAELYDAFDLFEQFRGHGTLKWRPVKQTRILM